jgi:hypothetical protein
VTLNPGGVFAGYLIERRLGVGGMGAVYAARHPRLPRRVALKVLGEHLGTDPEFRARFEREAEMAARVDHPNVVSVYDRGVEGDQPWIAMQYVDGVDVHQLIKRGVLTAGRAVVIVSEAAKGLDNAHRRGLLHRDVKPANILVAEDSDDGDHVLVTDFGIARAADQTSGLTNAGSIAATLPFASPEQIAGRELDHRSDVYSLGCTLYVMLTGALPFPRDSQIAVMHAHLTDPPPLVTSERPALPSELDDVIAKAMAKDPEHRYRSCRELAAAARAALLTSGGEHGADAATILAADFPSYERWDASNAAATQPNSFLPSDRAVATTGGARASADSAATMIPDHRIVASTAHAPAKEWGKRKMFAGAAIMATVVGLIVAGWLVFGVGQPERAPLAATSSATPTEPTAASSGPWQAYDFVANAVPGLLPDTPSGAAYQGDTCQPVNARFDPVDGLETEVPVARIMCAPADSARPGYIANYIVICSNDRTPQTLAGVADGLTAVRNEQWSRGGGSGQLVYGIHEGAGALAVSFDGPGRNFCSVVANGNKGTSGQDVYDHWFRDAPL